VFVEVTYDGADAKKRRGGKKRSGGKSIATCWAGRRVNRRFKCFKKTSWGWSGHGTYVIAVMFVSSPIRRPRKA